MSTRQTLKKFLSDRSLAANIISYNDSVSAGLDSNAVDEGDDLSFDPNTGKRLVNDGSAAGLVPDYLGYITTDAGNEFPIDGAGFKSAASSNRGQSLEQPENQGATKIFVKSSDYPIKESYFDGSGNPITNLVDKTGGTPAPSGPSLITTVLPASVGADSVPEQSQAVVATFSMLKKYNKYSDTAGGISDKFIGNTPDGLPVNTSNIDQDIKLSFQVEKGEYDPNDSSDSKHVKLEDMHAIAHSMLLKSAGWDPTSTAALSQDPDTFFSSRSPNDFRSYPTIIGSLFPDQVRARESFGAPTDGENSLLAGRGESVTRIGSDAVYTRSSLSSYTPDITFSQTTNSQESRTRFSIFQSAIAIVSLCDIIAGTFGRAEGYTSDSIDEKGLGPYYMGLTTRSKATALLRAVSNVALINTGRFMFDRCVRAGVTLYFGIDIDKIQGIAGKLENDSSTFTSSQIEAVSIIGSKGESPGTQSRLAQSYGFWHAVSKSCLRLINDIVGSLASSNSSLFADVITDLLSSKALRIANVFAQIGYTYLIAHLEDPDPDAIDPESVGETKKLVSAFSIDAYETLPGTRIMKSRDNSAKSALSLAWRHSAVPSAFLLPPSLIQASLDMDYILEGPNAVKFMVGTTMQDKTYASIRTKGRIPIEVVNNLENRLDAEYVPFYFHDLRTNELIGLHAFLENLTDNYSANFNTTTAHGRSDGIKNYTNTKRSISFSFWIVSTSEEDFDEMWAKVNKLVTLVYPQYTEGVLNTTQNYTFKTLGSKGQDFTFEQPFSQVVGASPIVRVRIGDVIKSNYSRFNLGRLFGAGNKDTGAQKNTNFSLLDTSFGATNVEKLAKSNIFSNALLMPLLFFIASPIELTTFSKFQGSYGQVARGMMTDVLDYLLKNGFVNPFLPGLLSTAAPFQGLSTGDTSDVIKGLSFANGRLFLKPRAEPYVFSNRGEQIHVKVVRPIQISVVGAPLNEPNKRVDPENPGQPIKVSVKVVSNIDLLPNTLFKGDITKLEDCDCDVTLDQCLLDPSAYFSTTLASFMFLAQASLQSALVQGASSVASSAAAASGFPVNTSVLTDLFGSYMRQFTSPLANPITETFEDSMSRGLAGVITGMQFNWLDQGIPWDTRWNSRAPQACKVSITFDPIHDIGPGLDVYGANRAPNYNVGNNNLLSGDPHSDNGLKSKEYYNSFGKIGTKYFSF